MNSFATQNYPKDENTTMEVSTTATTKDALRDMMLLNEQGALALRGGDEKQAHGTFRAVIAALGSFANSVQLDLDDLAPIQAKVLSSVEVPTMSDERFFVCGDALLFGWDDSQKEVVPPSVTDISFCSSVALFNMALNYHNRAMATGSRRYFELASKIYEQALLVVSSIDGFHEDLNKVRILLLNNLAHIYYFEFGEHPKAVAYLEQIQSALHFFLTDLGQEMDGFRPGTSMGVFLNLITTAPPFAAACA